MTITNLNQSDKITSSLNFNSSYLFRCIWCFYFCHIYLLAVFAVQSLFLLIPCLDLCLCGWWSYVALTGRRGVVFLRTCCSFSSSSSFLFPICSSHHPPGPSSAQAASGHLHSEALLRCPAPLWTHHSYLGVRSPGGRSSRQSAWNIWQIMRMLLYFWVTLAVMKNPFIKEVNAGMHVCSPEDLQRCEDCGQNIRNVRVFSHNPKGKRNGPCKTQDYVFYYGTVIVSLFKESTQINNDESKNK